jgi:hypothetical protein
MNFGPYEQMDDAESELVSLKMTSGQHITEYIVCFNSLAPCCGVMLPFVISSMRDSRTASRMKYLEVMRANPEPLTLWE